MSEVLLRKTSQCTSDQHKDVREVRNQNGVRRTMYIECELALDELPAWVQTVDSDNRKALSFVLMVGNASNVVSVDGNDRLHKNSYWAFQLDDSVRSGLRAALERKLSDFALNVLMLEKHICEVFDVNEEVVKSHKKFRFVDEGFERSNMKKYGDRIGVFPGITKDEWAEKRKAICDKYKTLLRKFDFSVEYEDD